MRQFHVILLLTIAQVTTVTGATAANPLEVTAEQYRKAEQWQRENVARLVKNLSVSPRWMDDSDAFWYLADTDDGKQFVRVDAASGAKTPLFDHAALAGALQAAGVEEVDARELPFASFTFENDGSAIAFSVEKAEYRCELQPASCKKVAKKPIPGGILVAPDGTRGVRTEGGNLYRVDLQTGEQTPLTHDGEAHFGYGLYYGNWKADVVPRERAGGVSEFPPLESHWAGNSRHLLATRLDERHVQNYYFLETAPNDGSFRPILHTARIPLTGEQPAGMDWFVVDAELGTSKRIDLPYDKLFHVHQDMLAIRKHWWSDDYSRLYLLAWGDLIKSAHLYEVDVATGKAREVLAEEMHPRMDTNSSSYNPPNVAVINDGEQAIWFSQRSGWGHLYLYDLQSGKLLNAITQGDWLVRDIIHVDEENRRLYFTGAGREGGNPYYRYLYRVDLDGSNLTLLSPEPADHLIESPYNDVLVAAGAGANAAVSPSGNYVAYSYSTVSEPPRSVIRRTDDGGLVAEFEAADASALYAAGWRNPEPFTVKAEDGSTDIHGLMYLPPNVDPDGKYPVIDSQYASPLWAVVPHNFATALMGPSGMYTPAGLSELGFVSVVIDARGTTFRDRAFSHHSWKNLNQIGLFDHIAALRQLAATRPWLDLDRVGIHGSSYGGFTTLRAMLEYPDFFKVGVAGVAVASFSPMYPDYHWESFHGEAIYSDETDRRPTPDARPVNYQNNDAVLQSGNLKGDLLLMLGELDENVFPATTLQFIDSLIRQDIDFDMYYFPNRPHHLASPFAMRKAWDYFVEHLLGAEPPKYRMTLKDKVWQE